MKVEVAVGGNGVSELVAVGGMGVSLGVCVTVRVHVENGVGVIEGVQVRVIVGVMEGVKVRIIGVAERNGAAVVVLTSVYSRLGVTVGFGFIGSQLRRTTNPRQ